MRRDGPTDYAQLKAYYDAHSGSYADEGVIELTDHVLPGGDPESRGGGRGSPGGRLFADACFPPGIAAKPLSPMPNVS